jgi:hypothetical protein
MPSARPLEAGSGAACEEARKREASELAARNLFERVTTFILTALVRTTVAALSSTAHSPVQHLSGSVERAQCSATDRLRVPLGRTLVESTCRTGSSPYQRHYSGHFRGGKGALAVLRGHTASTHGLGPVERATCYILRAWSATLYRVMERAAGVRSGNNVSHVTTAGCRPAVVSMRKIELIAARLSLSTASVVHGGECRGMSARMRAAGAVGATSPHGILILLGVALQ